MQKTILLLSGSPAGKSEFLKAAMEQAWVWNINFKNLLSSALKPVYEGERDETYYDFILEICKLANRYYNAEELYLRKKIQDFLNDGDIEKEDDKGNKYNKFLLILHGVSKDLHQILKDEFGAFQIHVGRTDSNTVTENKDLILYEDSVDFREGVLKTINVLTNKR